MSSNGIPLSRSLLGLNGVRVVASQGRTSLARGNGIRWRAGFAAILLSTVVGCGSLTHLVTSLGGEVAGDRGRVRVIVINNTPYRAVFTFGTFDDLDRFSEPDFAQFGSKDRESHLDGDSTSPILSVQCGRVFSVGGPRMFDLIEKNLPDAETIEEATIEGVQFFELPSDSIDDADAEPIVRGQAPALEALIGSDFACGSIIVLYLEFDDAGPDDSFRVDFRVIPAASPR